MTQLSPSQKEVHHHHHHRQPTCIVPPQSFSSLASLQSFPLPFPPPPSPPSATHRNLGVDAPHTSYLRFPGIKAPSYASPAHLAYTGLSEAHTCMRTHTRIHSHPHMPKPPMAHCPPPKPSHLFLPAWARPARQKRNGEQEGNTEKRRITCGRCGSYSVSLDALRACFALR